MDHLNDVAKGLLALSNEERIKSIKSDLWIGYTNSKEILKKLEDLLEHPRIHRMPNLLIVGATNNGKTAILKKFVSNHKPVLKPEGGVIYPVLSVQAPPTPDEKSLYNSILQKTFTPYKTSDRIEQKRAHVLHVLTRINLKILVIDEIHHILSSGNLKKQRSFLNELKYLSNELQLSIVCAGIKEAFIAIQTDSQMTNRFEPVILPKWRYNEDYLRLLASFERILPLKNPSNLTSEVLSKKILAMSEGTIGEISSLLKMCATQSILNGTEKITKKILDEVKWVSPSDRKKQVELVGS